MRQIGTLPNGQDARRFQDYLLTRGVKGMVEEEPEGWAVWIYNEDEVDQAKQELDEFAADPDKPIYREAAEAAGGLRRKKQRENEKARKQHIDVRRHWERPMIARSPVTVALIAISVAVTVLSSSFESLMRLGDKSEPLWTWLAIAPIYEGRTWQPRLGLQAIWEQGQVWRLVTPIFFHLSPFHILFNMLWLRELGGAIEYRRGTFRFLLIVLAIAVTSNVAQYWYQFHLSDVPQNAPFFGGMSGVVFGLFGYIWMKSRFDPGSGFVIPPQLVFFMIVWLVVCYTGAVGSIANAAHTAGLVFGLVLGYAPKLWRDLTRNAGS